MTFRPRPAGDRITVRKPTVPEREAGHAANHHPVAPPVTARAAQSPFEDEDPAMEDNLQTVFLSYPGSRDERLYTVLNEALAQLPEARVIDWPQFEKGEFIGPKIFEKIRESSLVVAVLNDETHRINENVLVEFGAAFALQRPVLPIVEKRALASVPFNLRDVALLEYDDRDLVTEEGRTEFRAQLTGCLRDHIERLLTTSQTGGGRAAPCPGTAAS